jgi:hypothetical protein
MLFQKNKEENENSFEFFSKTVAFWIFIHYNNGNDK